MRYFEFRRSPVCVSLQLSATRLLWLMGLYELSLSSAVGNLSGSPNVLQGVARDNVIPYMSPLAKGVSKCKKLHDAVDDNRVFCCH